MQPFLALICFYSPSLGLDWHRVHGPMSPHTGAAQLEHRGTTENACSSFLVPGLNAALCGKGVPTSKINLSPPGFTQGVSPHLSNQTQQSHYGSEQTLDWHTMWPPMEPVCWLPWRRLSMEKSTGGCCLSGVLLIQCPGAVDK